MRLTYKIEVLILFLNLLCVTCDPVMYPHRAKVMHIGNQYPPLVYRNHHSIDSYAAPSMQQRLYHKGPPPSYLFEEPRDVINATLPFGDVFNAMNELDSSYEDFRAANFRQEFPSYLTDLRTSGSPKHGHKLKPHVPQYEPPQYEEESSVPNYTTTSAPPTVPPSENKGVGVSFLKPDWNSIMKPAAPMNMDKWSGLLQLILSFITGSKSGNLEFKGFKDIILNGLVKPILTAKGNIKSFISKITIPLISLLLINVEILVTVWWLWEDCPKEMKLESMDTKSANNDTFT